MGWEFQISAVGATQTRFTRTPFEVRTWVGSNASLIPPLVDWLMNLIVESGCTPGEEQYVELAIREALNNARLHGNYLDTHKLVHVRCCCECTKGVSIVVRDQGEGFPTFARGFLFSNRASSNGLDPSHLTVRFSRPEVFDVFVSNEPMLPAVLDANGTVTARRVAGHQ